MAIKECSISSGTYMSILYRLFFVRWWWLMLLPVTVCLALIAVDTRFAYVALIVAMAVLMLSLPLLYYFALTQESRWSILEKKVSASEEGLRFDFTSEKMRSHVLPWSEIANTAATNDCLVLKLKRNRYTFVAIPLTAFASEEHLRNFVILVRSKIGERRK